MDGIENIDPDGTENKNIVNFSYSVGILQCEILVIDTWMVLKEDDTRLTMVWSPVESYLV